MLQGPAGARIPPASIPVVTKITLSEKQGMAMTWLLFYKESKSEQLPSPKWRAGQPAREMKTFIHAPRGLGQGGKATWVMKRRDITECPQHRLAEVGTACGDGQCGFCVSSWRATRSPPPVVTSS